MPTVEMLVYRMSNVVAASPITNSRLEVPFSDPRMTKRENLWSGFIFDILLVAASQITNSLPDGPFSDTRMTKRKNLWSGLIFDIFARCSKSGIIITQENPFSDRLHHLLRR